MDLGAMKTFEKTQFVEHQAQRRLEGAKALEVSTRWTFVLNESWGLNQQRSTTC